jgi:nitroreductase
VNSSIVASVVFLRIHDFARRPASEQARMRAQLEAVIAVVTADIAPVNRIVVEASDGTAVALIDDPIGALRLGQRALTAAAAGLPLSAGLNHGALQISGGKGAEGLRGDGIAVAASIAESATASRLLASRSFRDALADAAPGREAELVPAGTYTDAGPRSHEVFAPDDKALARRRRRYAAATVALMVALFGAGLGWRVMVEGPKSFASPAMANQYFRALVQRVSY